MNDYDSTLDEPRKGYGDRTITEHFDDLAPGIYVTMKNPAMMPASALAPKQDLSKIKDRQKIMELSNAWLASFVVDWKVYDVTDFGSEPVELGDPDADTINRCPSPVTTWMIRKISEVSDPR